MPAPVINTTTSILDYLQHQVWSYQPFATNKPTSWSIDPIAPPGMAFDPATGTISGACSVAGVYVFAITATNALGDSSPLVVTVGIEAAPQDPRSLAVEVNVDLVSRVAVVAGLSAAAAYQHAVKNRDDLIYHVRFFKGATRVDPPLTKVSWSLKRNPDGDVLAASGAWLKVGFGSEAAWAVHGSLTQAALLSELLDIEETEKTPAQQFVGTIEFEWLQANGATGAIGPDPLRGSSQPMNVLVVNDQQQTPAE